MPKSRRGRKSSFRAKKAKARQNIPVAAVQQQAVTSTVEPVALPKKPVPSAAASALKVKSALRTYAYVGSELRRIGILAGIMIIIIIVLAVVLP